MHTCNWSYHRSTKWMESWNWKSIWIDPTDLYKRGKNILYANSKKHYMGSNNHWGRGSIESTRSSSTRIFLRAKRIIYCTSNKHVSSSSWQSFMLMTSSFWQVRLPSWSNSSSSLEMNLKWVILESCIVISEWNLREIKNFVPVPWSKEGTLRRSSSILT